MAPSTRSSKTNTKVKSKGGSKENKFGGTGGSVALTLNTWISYYTKPEFIKNALVDPEYTWIIAIVLFITEIFINSFIILYRPYTEIDWIAYMQEVEGFLNGTLDYQYLKGDTGPLVYPAGFVHIFSLLYFLTENGTNIFRAQWIYAFFYLLLIQQIFRLYCRSKKVPPYALFFLTFTSYRVHSIFVLRLFNDPLAILLLYFALNSFLDGRWTLGSLSYSLAVSIKMNVLLYAPALLIFYMTQLRLFDAIVQLSVCASLQVVLALPFLLVNPWSYISRSFDLGRVFLYEWTVNWKFLPEEIFLDRYFHLALLVMHLIVLGLFAPSWIEYMKTYFKLEVYTKNSEAKEPLAIRAQLVLFPLFVSNFIGICFSRSLHYQFYIWYYHTIPYLLWSTRLPVRAKLSIFGIIELCWNTFPANYFSSLSLVLCHLLMLVGLWQYKSPQKTWNVEMKSK